MFPPVLLNDRDIAKLLRLWAEDGSTTTCLIRGVFTANALNGSHRDNLFSQTCDRHHGSQREFYRRRSQINCPTLADNLQACGKFLRG